MLRDLTVKNLAVLARATVELGEGLNTLTGETGAGKSIVVDSLALLGGARASGDLIRSGTDLLTVVGRFEPDGSGWRRVLEGAGVEAEEDGVLVRREIHRSGRNRVFVNDQPATLRLLADLAPWLLRIHTQREELGLVSPELQRQWLDRVGGSEGAAIRARVRAAWEGWRDAADRLERARGDERTRLERIDLLRFQAGEIDAARVQAGEDEALRAERSVLRHAEAIGQALSTCWRTLHEEDDAAVDRLARSASALADIAEWEPEAGAWAEELDDLRIRLEELAESVRDRGESVEADPGLLDEVEERLATLERLARKYGGSADAILSRRAEIGEELEDLEGSEERRRELEQAAADALAGYREAGGELSRLRSGWAETLREGVHRELADLAMGRARFSVDLATRVQAESPLEIEGRPVAFGPDGWDLVTFELAANPGEPGGPLGRVASGGELSRVYLALQLAAGEEDPDARPTLVFDEVDAGIGGAEAAALGEKLQRLATGSQILAVTHLPQVASRGDRHFRVAKELVGERTAVDVHHLEMADRVEEVARMMAGELTDLSLSHAEEMLTAARRRS